MVAGARTEVATPPEVLKKLLGAVDDKVVLVGGQALGFWVQRYDLSLPVNVPVISSDSDFLVQSAADRVTVASFAQAIGGRAKYPPRTALTALVGQAELDISDSEYVNVDVIFTLTGLSAHQVLSRATRVDVDETPFLVMHPLHVLQSRLSNLHTLHEKKNEKGSMQLAMAIQVGREFLRETARSAPESDVKGRHPLQPFVSEIERMALSDAGRKVALRWGLHVADAIDPRLIRAGPFWAKKWPTLRTLMSTDFVASIVQELTSRSVAKKSRSRTKR